MLTQLSQSEENIKQIELDLIAFEHKMKMLKIELGHRNNWLRIIKVLHRDFGMEINIDGYKRYINSLKQMLNKY